MKPNKPNDLILQDVYITYKNFEGKATAYNREGDRNFAVLIDPEIHDVEALMDLGWNLKEVKQYDPEEPPLFYIPVAIGFNFPPLIFMVDEHKKTLLDETTVALLDSFSVKSVDLVLNGSPWAVTGAVGIKAWLKKGYFNIEVDELDSKYDDIPLNTDTGA